MKRTLARIAAFFALGLFLALPGHQAIGQSASGYPLNSVAGWDITKVAYVPVDNDSGNDTANCLIVATAGSTLSPSGHTCKTLEHVLRIIPRNGNGRSLVILLKPRSGGATYRNIANSADDVADLLAVAGYKRFYLRGSTDLTNSATDRLRAGGITAFAGPNGDSSWTCAAGATATTLTAAAGSLPTDLNAAGLRVRYTGNITAGLANVSRTIHSSLAGTLTFSTAGTACASGDFFFVEKPGVAVANIVAGPWALADSSAAIVGITTTSNAVNNLTFGAGSGTYTVSFLNLLGTVGANLNSTFGGGTGNIFMGDSYIDETVTTQITGGNRFLGSVLVRWFPGPMFIDSSAFMLQSSRSFDFVGPTQLWVGVNGAVTFSGGVVLSACGSIGGQDGTFIPPVMIGRQLTSTIPRTRILGNGLSLSGALTIVACSGVVGGVDITGGTYAIRIRNAGGAWWVSDTSGTATTAGISMTITQDTTLIVNTSNVTFTGGNGAIEWPGPAYGAIADLALSNVIDNAGNRTMAPNVAVAGQAVLVSNQSGGALSVGSPVKSNGTTGQVTCAKADTSDASSFVSGVMVTAPASGSLGYMVAQGAPYVLYDGAPTAGATAYLSPGTACRATTTVPAASGSNRRLRIGRNLTVSGSTGYTAWHPESYSTAGVAPGTP